VFLGQINSYITGKILTVNQRVLGSSPKGGAAESATYNLKCRWLFYYKMENLDTSLKKTSGSGG